MRNQKPLSSWREAREAPPSYLCACCMNTDDSSLHSPDAGNPMISVNPQENTFFSVFRIPGLSVQPPAQNHREKGACDV